MDDKKRTDDEIVIIPEKEERIKDNVYKRSYRPTEDDLDLNDPPNDGSGVPDKEEQKP
jgi:hypothetical protein